MIPPLRTRTGDIPILAHHFVERFCRDLKKATLRLSPWALVDLCTYGWPGNVRELQNCIERAVILGDGDSIQPRHLNLTFRSTDRDKRSGGADDGSEPPDPWTHIELSGTMSDVVRRVTAEVERRKIKRALEDAVGNKERAAEALQISVKTLLQKQKEYGVPEGQ
jgi:DNA-binding NtrC family response regulator